MEGVDLTIDFCWLYIQIVILMVIVSREYARPSQRNFFAMLISGGILILVSGQAWWMLRTFDESGAYEMVHLYQTISLHGARLANFYTGIGIVCYGIVFWAQRKRRPVVRKYLVDRYNHNRFQPNQLTYLFIGSWVAVMASAMLVSAGGVVAALTAPGLNFAYGVTMLLILISVGKFPLLQKMVSKKSIRPIDVGLFLVVLLFTLFNSRILAAMILLQLVVVINYSRHEISRRMLLLVPLLIFLIFIVFGLYRDFASRTGGAIEFDALFYFIAEINGDGLIDWFYGKNIESFAGLAGILTYEISAGSIQHDYGLSNLGFLGQFIPGSLRNDPELPIKFLIENLASVYPYKGSIISPGLEIAYANFGLLGIMILGGLLASFAQFLHSAMVSRNFDRLKIGVISVQPLQMVRGTFANVLFFGLSDLIMLSLYRLILKVSRGLMLIHRPSDSSRLYKSDLRN